MKKIVTNGLKFAVTAGLIYWLVRSGNLGLEGLRGAFEHPAWIAAGLLSVGLVVLTSLIRWHLLVRAQNIPIPFSASFKLSLIGLFFSTVIPGGVSGDLMKIYYIGEHYPRSRSATVLSILGDRIIGLSTLMLFALIALAFRFNLVVSSPQIRSIAAFTGVYFSGLLVVLPFILSSRIRHHRFTVALLEKLPVSSIITRLYDALHTFKERPINIGGALLAGGFAALFSAFAFYCFGQSLEISTLGLADYCLVIPLIFIVVSVPISPAGIGVGQAAALFLFRWIGTKDDSFGANLMTLYQVAVVLFALAGALVFLTYKKEMKTPVQSQTEENQSLGQG